MSTFYATHQSPDVHVMWEFTRAKDREDYVEYDSTYRSYAEAPPEGTRFDYQMVQINGRPVRAGFRDLLKDPLPEPNPEPLRTIYSALPDDVKRKVSCHDLKRICDALFPVAKDQQPPVRTLLLSLITALDGNQSEEFFDRFLELTDTMKGYCDEAVASAEQDPNLTK